MEVLVEQQKKLLAILTEDAQAAKRYNTAVAHEDAVEAEQKNPTGK